MKLGNLAARVATAAVLVPLLILAILWKRHEAVWGLVFVATLLALHEFFSITLPDRVEKWFGVGLGAAASLILYWAPHVAFTLVPLVVIVPALFFLFRFGDMKTVINRLGVTTFGVLYAGSLLTFLALLKRLPNGSGWVLLTLMIAWFGDTGAYFAGRFLGKTKLYPAVSPGKTRAGALGGLAGSFLGAVLANLWFFKELGWHHGAILTICGGALGQSGDLVESMLKRAYGVKDSGKLLPGHGGMLDRVDAVLFIAPAVFVYATLAWGRF
jgi:phosphatidate cytidylyltransferase